MLYQGCSLGRAGTARQTAGSGAQGSRARGQEGAAGSGCGCEGRRGTSVQKRVRPPGAVVLQVDPQSAAERAGLKPGEMRCRSMVAMLAIQDLRRLLCFD